MSIQIECEECGFLCEQADDGTMTPVENQEIERLREENESLRAILDDEGYVRCPACGGYETGTIPDANNDPAADYCKTCGHTW